MQDQTTLDKGLKVMVRSSFIIFLGVFLEKFISYIYRIIVARHFGPEIYGTFSLALMILGWFISISTLGLNNGLVRYISLYRGKKEKNKIKFLFKSVLVLIILTSLLSGILLFFSASFISLNFFHDTSLIIFLKIFSVAIPLTVVSNSLLSAIRAFEKIAWYSFIFNILQNLSRFIVLIALIFIGLKSNSVIFSYLTSALITLIASYLVCRYKISELFGKYFLKKEIKQKTFNELFSYSWPLLFFSVIWSIFHWSDSFMIGLFGTVKDVGIYNAAVPIAFLLMLTSDLFLLLFFPLITREYSQKNFYLIKELSKQVGKWIFTLNLPLLLLIILFPGSFINLFFGKAYLGATTSLRFLAIGTFFHSIFMVSNNLISVVGKSGIVLIDIVSVSVINIILNFFLIPRYGIGGAAFSTMISLIILDIIFLLQAKKYTAIIPLRRSLLKILLVSLIPTVILLLLKTTIGQISFIKLVLLGSLFILLYLLLIFITKSIDVNDSLVILAIKRKLGFRENLSQQEFS